MAAQFKDKLKEALEKFEVQRAEQIGDEIHEAELIGYELTAQEEKLWERLTACIQSYYRNMAAL
jgi:hypothetical protein